MAAWDNDAERRRHQKAEARRRAGNISSPYEINHDAAYARAFVYGHISDSFTSREELVRNLERLEPSTTGGDVYDVRGFEECVRAMVGDMVKEYDV